MVVFLILSTCERGEPDCLFLFNFGCSLSGSSSSPIQQHHLLRHCFCLQLLFTTTSSSPISSTSTTTPPRLNPPTHFHFVLLSFSGRTPSSRYHQLPLHDHRRPLLHYYRCHFALCNCLHLIHLLDLQHHHHLFPSPSQLHPLVCRTPLSS